MALVAYDSSGEESDGGQPPESLRSKERDQKSMLSAYVFASSGLGKKGQRKVVRIGLPELAGQEDSDEEESQPQEKKPKIVQEGRSGLSSLLPSPKSGFGTKSTRATASIDTASSRGKHVVEVTSSQPAKRSTSLVPHSVSKKQRQQTASKNREDGGSSDEDDSVPFFSHLSPTATTTPSIEDRITSAIQQPSLVQETPISEGLAGYALNNSHQSQAYVTLGEPPGTSWYSGSHTYASYPDPTADYTLQQQYQYSYQQGQSAHSYGQQGDNPVQIEGGVSAGNEPELDNESLKRLMGGRNWKHKKESVTLRDVNEEEIAQTGQHMRLVHSTEEMDALALASKSQKSVSSTEKRKHQITFLAAEAKARELQLKNQWSQNRMTRRQTQMKYGF